MLRSFFTSRAVTMEKERAFSSMRPRRPRRCARPRNAMPAFSKIGAPSYYVLWSGLEQVNFERWRARGTLTHFRKRQLSTPSRPTIGIGIPIGVVAEACGWILNGLMPSCEKTRA
eukprot:1177792-Prorocentrum_minimum.AAC.1